MDKGSLEAEDPHTAKIDLEVEPTFECSIVNIDNYTLLFFFFLNILLY